MWQSFCHVARFFDTLHLVFHLNKYCIYVKILSNAIVKNYFMTFLQIIGVTDSYWFSFGLATKHYFFTYP